MPTRRLMKKKPSKKPPAKKPPKAAKSKPAATTKPPAKSDKTPAAPPRKGGKGAAGAVHAYDAINGIIDAFSTSNRITQFLVDNLHEDTWHAPPLGGRGRSIVAIVCHIHNARVMWLEAARSAGKAPKPPAKLDRLAATKEEAIKALELSHAAIAKMVAPALRGDGKVADFKAGAAAFMAYLITHDAHHRGQICLQAKQVGHPVSEDVGYGMWEWSKR